ncbi:MAG: thiolase family protein [Clostridia bacterium]|jgi:acetyl-CoA acetyltransferase|nr:thiolase family protein [Clostridia bacterium]
MRPVDIIGVGITPFGKHPDKSVVQLGSEAALQAIKEAGVKPSDIGACFFANMQAPRLLADFTLGQNVFWEVGINRVPVFNVENACTSGSSAFNLAWMGVASGMYDLAMVVGAEKLMVPQLGLMQGAASEIETLEGLVVVASFAMRAKLHMETFGTTKEQLALVAVKNRRHGSLNPLAQFREPITVEDVLNAPMIADPLTRLSCCPNADGAAAVVLCAAELSKRYTSRPIHVAASVLISGRYENPCDLLRWEADERASRMAYEMAGLGPGDLDVIECHDAFTISEILHYEGLGLCAPGEGGRLVESGATSLGGKIPVNPSGGLLAKGHPVGATAVAQIVEGVLQLRGQAGARQVEGAKVFMAECMGADKAGDTKTCTINILYK